MTARKQARPSSTTITTSSKPPSSSSSWNPDILTDNPTLLNQIHASLAENDLTSAITTAFNLPTKQTDEYTYHAGAASVTLSDAQRAIHAGPTHGLHDWYACHPIFGSSSTPAPNTNSRSGSESQSPDNAKHSEDSSIQSETETKTQTALSLEGKRTVQRPSKAEIAGYISLFDPSKAPANTLKGLRANAKRNSIQAAVADHLLSNRHISASDRSLTITVSKNKKSQQQQQQPHSNANIYVDFWAWSCVSLEWAGPETTTAQLQLSHHVLPVFMHHFGCVCPSHEALELIRRISAGRTVLDIGSGNGYWSYMLRRHGCEVLAVDNMQSRWRTVWIGDTIVADAIKYIQTQRDGAGKKDVLLMVYPVVGAGFTAGVLEAYRGDVVCVAGTQNGNGYTGFKGETIDQWMEREREEFEKIVQIPLPSFAGKDDALFVFRRREKGGSGLKGE